jgi:hypothetical protein
MKTLATIFMALTLCGNAKAGNATEENSSKIKTSLVMPQSMRQQAARHPDGQKVSFSFVVNETGKVTEVSAKIKDAEARRDLEAQFMKLTFASLEPCVRHGVEINFILY